MWAHYPFLDPLVHDTFWHSKCARQGPYACPLPKRNPDCSANVKIFLFRSHLPLFLVETSAAPSPSPHDSCPLCQIRLTVLFEVPNLAAASLILPLFSLPWLLSLKRYCYTACLVSLERFGQALAADAALSWEPGILDKNRWFAKCEENWRSLKLNNFTEKGFFEKSFRRKMQLAEIYNLKQIYANFGKKSA